LNDAAGRHVKDEDVFAALDGARGGGVVEGSVGAGTGMQTFGFAGGIGTSSRVVTLAGEEHVVGALVLSNFGDRDKLRIDGVPVGHLLAERFDHLPERGAAGSIIVLVATDVPSSARQLERLARRAALAIGRVGGYAAHNSGEILLAWSTANRVPRKRRSGRHKVELVLDAELDPLYEATVDTVEEAILNAIVGGSEMIGQSDRVAPALPLEEVRTVLGRYRPSP
jgi:D-aminopeptidase